MSEYKLTHAELIKKLRAGQEISVYNKSLSQAETDWIARLLCGIMHFSSPYFKGAYPYTYVACVRAAWIAGRRWKRLSPIVNQLKSAGTPRALRMLAQYGALKYGMIAAPDDVIDFILNITSGELC